jgi:hypothetical protein
MTDFIVAHGDGVDVAFPSDAVERLESVAAPGGEVRQLPWAHAGETVSRVAVLRMALGHLRFALGSGVHVVSRPESAIVPLPSEIVAPLFSAIVFEPAPVLLVVRVEALQAATLPKETVR